MGRLRDHRPRVDATVCPDPDGCARLYHPTVMADVDRCECCGGEMSPAPPTPADITPAQRRVLDVVDARGEAWMGAHTNRQTNTVNARAAAVLVRRGILETFLGGDGTYVRRPDNPPTVSPARPTATRPGVALARALRDLGLAQGPGKDFRVYGEYNRAGERRATWTALTGDAARTALDNAEKIRHACQGDGGWLFTVEPVSYDNIAPEHRPDIPAVIITNGR